MVYIWGVMVITTAQLHSTKSELKFCTGSNPARGVLEICDSDDLWQSSQLKIRLNTFRPSTISQKHFIIIIIIIIIIRKEPEQNRAHNSSKNVGLLCYEGFSFFSTDFKGNRNEIYANISSSKNLIKNCGHGFLLLFILTSWIQK